MQHDRQPGSLRERQQFLDRVAERMRRRQLDAVIAEFGDALDAAG
jgi:hypothetical protein